MPYLYDTNDEKDRRRFFSQFQSVTFIKCKKKRPSHRDRSEATPRSRSSNASSSRLTGCAAAGSSLRVTAACSWMSSASSSSGRAPAGGDVDEVPVVRARERTTSPLQMGHVRRRVVSQGVLRYVSNDHMVGVISTYMHSAWNS